MTTEAGTHWGEGEARRYEVAKHGPDGKQFLDPYLYKYLETQAIRDNDVIDIGSGTGPWAKYVKELGAKHVVVADLNMGMLRQAQTKSELQKDGVLIEQADAGKLPHPDNCFGVELSINVGCNLPNLQEHFKEAYRTAKEGGTMIVTAPDSLTTAFTDGEISADEIQNVVDSLWERQTNKTAPSAKKVINSLEHVLRATFILDVDNKPILITESNKQLVKPGDPIIRRIPGLAVDNIYHTAQEYIEQAEDAGWNIEQQHEESFSSADALSNYNNGKETGDKLGPEYVGNPPFLVMKLTKTNS